MKKILYIEDNEDNIFLFTRRLGKAGYEVVVARDGVEGIAMARSDRPTLIMMDLDLPILDGWSATRLLKASPATADIPVIVVSAHAMAQDRRRAFEAGCDEFFAKPVDMKALVAAIEARGTGTSFKRSQP